MSDTAGYSGTPLIRKLGLKAGMSVRLIDAPEHYWRLLGGTPHELDVDPIEGDPHEVAFTHLFADTREALERHFRRARASMAEDGTVWASWPKKSSGRASEIGRSEVMAAGKSVGLVDVKVCAVDETWSGLKFVVPVDDRSD